MASINDNLFTTLTQYASPGELGCRILTEWGTLIANFSRERITELHFEDTTADLPEADSVFRTVFLDWLAHYQSLAPAIQWQYLAPQGTPFQLAVWRALIDVPHGERVSYQSIAQAIGKPKANRAVGSAVGANPISILIPCHRVIQSTGAIGNYRWGADRKLALLDAEQEAGSDLLRLFK
ncbi:MAG: methylated-DNA--[protein]-cysteine S-methyltransferase [Opitutaceae bacterium]